MDCLSVKEISVSHSLFPSWIVVFIKHLFSDSPFELVTFLLLSKGAEQEIFRLGFSGKGDTSNLTYFFFLTLKISICFACKDEVWAPVSTLALIAGIFSEDKFIHSSQPSSKLFFIFGVDIV